MFTMLKNFDFFQLKKWQMDETLKKLHKAYREKYRSKTNGYQCKFRAFTDIEVKKFFDYVDGVDDAPFYILWKIMAETGIRPEEARKLKITDFSEEERHLRIVNWKVNEQINIIPISRKLTEIIKAYILANYNFLSLKGGWLFPTVTKPCHMRVPVLLIDDFAAQCGKAKTQHEKVWDLFKGSFDTLGTRIGVLLATMIEPTSPTEQLLLKYTHEVKIDVINAKNRI